MRFHSLQQWLAWQETLHPKKIDLGLDRVAAVADALGLRQQPPVTVVVGGTNGKGTVATVVAELLQALGFRVGRYTSPHLLRYNERVVIDGAPVSDAELCRAFAVIDDVRGEHSLSYFEFGTLAAVWLFRERQVDYQVLEVGLGGRLDAVNVWDADVAAITCVDLDHQEWLGSDREQIGREKAGIMRAGRPVVLGEANPPESVLKRVRDLGAEACRLGHDFWLDPDCVSGGWCWRGQRIPLALEDAARLRLDGARGRNVATALAILHRLGLQERLTPEVLRAGWRASPPARLQRLAGRPEWLLDVAHNPQSARELARWLTANPVSGPVVAMVAVMADKEREPMFDALRARVDVWIPIDVPGGRALAADVLATELSAIPGAKVLRTDTTEQAISLAKERAGEFGRVVVFGSFVTVQAVLERL